MTAGVQEWKACRARRCRRMLLACWHNQLACCPPACLAAPPPGRPAPAFPPAAGGFNPGRVLPCVIDVGTNNELLRNEPW